MTASEGGDRVCASQTVSMSTSWNENHHHQNHRWQRTSTSASMSQHIKPRSHHQQETPSQTLLHTFGDDFSCSPFMTPFRMPCQHHSHMSQSSWWRQQWKRPRSRGPASLLGSHAHTNLFAPRSQFGGDVVSLFFSVTVVSHITLGGKKHQANIHSQLVFIHTLIHPYTPGFCQRPDKPWRCHAFIYWYLMCLNKAKLWWLHI